MKTKYIILIILIIMALSLTGCIPGDGKHTQEKPAGFFWGIWHGWIAPISLIVGIFNKDITIFETANTGWWYNLGFYMAVVSGFGGLAFRRRKKRKRDYDIE